jgi:integrase
METATRKRRRPARFTTRADYDGERARVSAQLCGLVRTRDVPIQPGDIVELNVLATQAELAKEILEGRRAAERQERDDAWPTLGFWFDEWFRLRHEEHRFGRRCKDPSWHRRLWGVVKAELENVPMRTADSELLSSLVWGTLVDRGLSDKTRLEVWLLLKAMYADAQEHGVHTPGSTLRSFYPKTNPLDGVARPAGHSKGKPVVTLDDVGRVLELLRKMFPPNHVHYWIPHVVAISAATGLRISESAHLRWRHVIDRHIDEDVVGYFEWQPGELKHGRFFRHPITPELRRLLPAERGEPEALVFKTPERVDKDVNRALKHAAGELGLPPFTSHNLRHMYAQEMRVVDASIYQIQEALGHQSFDTTLRYLRSRAQVSEIADKARPIARAIAGRVVPEGNDGA